MSGDDWRARCDCPGAGHDPEVCAALKGFCRKPTTYPSGRICGKKLPCPDHGGVTDGD